MDNFMAAREGIVNQDTVKQKQMENIMLNDWRHKNADFRGRMSPMAKELLYKEYLKGATVKKLIFIVRNSPPESKSYRLPEAFVLGRSLPPHGRVSHAPSY